MLARMLAPLLMASVDRLLINKVSSAHLSGVFYLNRCWLVYLMAAPVAVPPLM